jgi:hypothetical protein
MSGRDQERISGPLENTTVALAASKSLMRRGIHQIFVPEISSASEAPHLTGSLAVGPV